MSSIDKAIEQLEKSVEKIRKFSVSESRAVQKAVKESSGSARSRVGTDYAATRKRLLKEANDAEKSIKEAITRIEKAFADVNPVKRSSRPAAKKKPAKKAATKTAATKTKAKSTAKSTAKSASKSTAKPTSKAKAKKPGVRKAATKSAAKKPAAKKTTKKPAAKKKPAARK